MVPPAPSAPSAPADTRRIGFLGPQGTFTEQALLTQADLKGAELVPCETIAEVIAATAAGELDLGFVPIENAIEGTVNVTLDTLAFDTDLLIQREVEISIQLDLLGVPGADLAGITTVTSYPHALAQCPSFLHRTLPEARTAAATSTAEAARLVAEAGDPTVAAIGTALAAEIYGLDVLATDIEDHTDNQTRFVLLAREGMPPASGHDKTSVVVFQRTDRPGTLLTILGEFAARSINLTKLESRPTKKGLGHYCFIIDLEGHIAEELVADCLRDLKSKCEDVKFLGSYPAAGAHGPAVRREAEAAWADADAWLARLRAQIQP